MDLERLSRKNNEQMQKFCNLKISELSNLQHIYECRVKERGYFNDLEYLNERIGKCKVETAYYSYFLYLLQEEYKNFKDVKKFEFSQIEMR